MHVPDTPLGRMRFCELYMRQARWCRGQKKKRCCELTPDHFNSSRGALKSEWAAKCVDLLFRRRPIVFVTLSPIVHHFLPTIVMVADHATCLQLVGRNVARQASEMKDCVKRGLPLPNIWLIHLMGCYWWPVLHANINWLSLPSFEAAREAKICAAE